MVLELKNAHTLFFKRKCLLQSQPLAAIPLITTWSKAMTLHPPCKHYFLWSQRVSTSKPWAQTQSASQKMSKPWTRRKFDYYLLWNRTFQQLFCHDLPLYILHLILASIFLTPHGRRKPYIQFCKNTSLYIHLCFQPPGHCGHVIIVLEFLFHNYNIL